MVLFAAFPFNILQKLFPDSTWNVVMCPSAFVPTKANFEAPDPLFPMNWTNPDRISPL